jgi:uncharacterized integral membrane protein
MRWRLYLSCVLLTLVLTFVVQNTETVTFNFLFWSFGLPRALLLLVVFLVGISTGLLLVASRGGRRDKGQDREIIKQTDKK